MSDSRTLSDTRPRPLVLGATALAVAGPTPFDDAYQAAAEYSRHARAANTVRAYSSDWRDFVAWCRSAQLDPAPAKPETVAWYIAQLAQRGRKPSTIERRLSAISQAHKQLELEPPTAAAAVRNVLAGIKRTHGTAQDAKAPALLEDLKAMLATLDTAQLRDLRDRALLLVGFAGAFRREEVAAIAVEDLEWTRAGLVVLVRHSKTDQEGQGRKVGLPFGQHAETCPVRALRAWIKASGVARGRVFRGVDRWGHVLEHGLCDRTVARVVKRLAGAAGLDADRFGGHSLRAGFATAAAKAKVSERDIMRQTGHKSVEMVRRYIRDAELFSDNAAAGVGL